MEAKQRVKGYTSEVLFWAWEYGHQGVTCVILESAAKQELGGEYSMVLNLLVTETKGALESWTKTRYANAIENTKEARENRKEVYKRSVTLVEETDREFLEWQQHEIYKICDLNTDVKTLTVYSCV